MEHARFDERTLIPVLPIEAKRDVRLRAGLAIVAWVALGLLGWGLLGWGAWILI